MKLINIIVLCLLNFTVIGQNLRFSKSFDNSSCPDVLSNSILKGNKNYYFLVESLDPYTSLWKINFLETNIKGEVLKQKFFSLKNGSYGCASDMIDYKGGILVAAWESDSLMQNLYTLLLNFNLNGDTLWEKKVKGPKPRSFVSSSFKTSDGGFAFCGRTSNNYRIESDVFVFKIDSNFNVLWKKSFGDYEEDVSFSGVEGDNFDIFLAGLTRSNAYGQTDGYLVKVDSIGNKIWDKHYGSQAFPDGFSKIIKRKNGNYLLAGEKFFGLNVETDQGWLVEIDSSGKVVKERTYGGSKNYDGIWDIKELPDGDIIIAGSTNNTPKTTQAGWAMYLNSNLDSVWSKYYFFDSLQGNFPDIFYNVTLTNDGGFLFSGTCLGKNNTQDAWLVKTDCMGNDSVNYNQPGITCSPLTQLRELSKINRSLKVFPNPMWNSGTLLFPVETEERYTFDIYDLQGQKLFSFDIPGGLREFKFTNPGLSPGFYLYKVSSVSHEYNTERLIVY